MEVGVARVELGVEAEMGVGMEGIGQRIPQQQIKWGSTLKVILHQHRTLTLKSSRSVSN